MSQNTNYSYTLYITHVSNNLNHTSEMGSEICAREDDLSLKKIVTGTEVSQSKLP